MKHNTNVITVTQSLEDFPNWQFMLVRWIDPSLPTEGQPLFPGHYYRNCGASPSTAIPDFFDGKTWWSCTASGERNNRPAFSQNKRWCHLSSVLEHPVMARKELTPYQPESTQ